jgi:membrane protein
MKSVRTWLQLLKKSAIEFLNDNAIKLSASLSYYTIFSVAPMLIVIISFAGIFFGRDAIEGKIYGQIKGLIGDKAAVLIQGMIAGIKQTQHTITGATIGIIILVLGATGVFTEIQGSINFIWSVKAKPKKGWLKLIINRVISFSLVISCGFILMVSLILNALMDLLNDRLTLYLHNFAVTTIYIINLCLIFIVIALMFAIIFKVLPDARIRWRDAFAGSIFTSILFLGGKFLISLYLVHSKIGLTYGAAASAVILLLWVYYSSIILYFGAEFTKVYTIDKGSGIRPTDNSVFIIKRESKEIGGSFLS